MGNWSQMRFVWKENKFLVFLLSILFIVLVAGGAFYVRTWLYEQDLRRLARDIVEEVNREDFLPMPEEGPEAGVEVNVTCSFEYLFFGPATGKITLIIKPRPHAGETRIGGISYVYAYKNGEWVEQESYHE